MSRNWIAEIKHDSDKVDDFVTDYKKKLNECQKDLTIDGNLIQLCKDMPVIVDKVFSLFQDANTILKIIEIELDRARSHHFRTYMNGSNRTYSSRDIEKFIDGEPDVVDLAYKHAQVAQIADKFAGVSKAVAAKEFQLSNITRLKVAGLDDADIF